jgi:hypothetical protein
MKRDDQLRKENTCSFVPVLHNLGIATFALNFWDDEMSEGLRNRRAICKQSKLFHKPASHLQTVEIIS